MSIVVCTVGETFIKVAADSALTYHNSMQLAQDFQKVRLISGTILSGAGNPEDLMLFSQYMERTDALANLDVKSLFDYFVRFKKWALEEAGRDIASGGSFETDYIVVADGKAFIIEGFHIREIKQFHAFGDGMDFALGALECYSTAIDAVRIACKYNIYCKGPIYTYVYNKKTKSITSDILPEII